MPLVRWKTCQLASRLFIPGIFNFSASFLLRWTSTKMCIQGHHESQSMLTFADTPPRGLLLAQHSVGIWHSYCFWLPGDRRHGVHLQENAFLVVFSSCQALHLPQSKAVSFVEDQRHSVCMTSSAWVSTAARSTTIAALGGNENREMVNHECACGEG